MPSLADALTYSALGIAIFPVWYLSSDGVCACSVYCGRNACKHPIGGPRGAEHGVNSATTDEAVITRWWSLWPTANIGTALGAPSLERIGFDVDDPAIADSLLLLAPTLAERGIFIARSRRGVHLVFRGDFQGQAHIYTSDRKRVGELRGTGTYLVAPPSISATGIPYTHVAGPLDPAELARAANPMNTVSKLLRSVGITMGPMREGKVFDFAPATPIEPQDLPFPARSERIKSIINGTSNITDRSVMLFQLGRAILERAERASYAITDEQVAGIIKKVDTHENYRKYTGRSDEDKQYYIIPIKIKDGVRTPDEQAPTETQRQLGQNYVWSEAMRSLIYAPANSRKEIRVGNFRPSVIAETTVLKDGEVHDRAFVVRCVLAGGAETDVYIPENDLTRTTTLRTTFQKQLGRDYIVEPEQWERVWNAAREFAEGVDQEVAYAQYGWNKTQDGWVFALPSGTTITSTGIDDTVQIHGPDIPDNYLRYGINVRPAATPEERESVAAALCELFTVAEPRVALPVLLFAFAAPLNSWEIAPNPPLLHLHGESGAHKTSLCLTVLNLYGSFPSGINAGRTVSLSTYASTVNALEMDLSSLRDLICLIDDFKPEVVKLPEITRLVQTYGDASTRSRLTKDATHARSRVPTALWLSTGQDDWSHELSTALRTLPLPVTEMDIPVERLSALQDLGADGTLALVGGSYLRFLASRKDALSPLLKSFRNDERRTLNFAAHDRVLLSVSALRAVGRVLRMWLLEEYPTALPAFDTLLQKGWLGWRALLVDTARNVSSLTPAGVVLDAIREAMNAGTARLIPRGHIYDNLYEKFKRGALGSPIGFYDEEFVYVSENLTYTNWLRTARQRAGAPITFSWRALKRSLCESADAEDVLLREFGSTHFTRIPFGRTGIVRDELEATEETGEM